MTNPNIRPATPPHSECDQRDWFARHGYMHQDMSHRLGDVRRCPQRAEGNNFAATERKGNSLEPYEMHAGWRPDSYGSISLKWQPKAES